MRETIAAATTATIMIDYNPGASFRRWRYDAERMRDWKWIGTGASVRGAPARGEVSYARDEQFGGPISTAGSVASYLSEVFTGLADQNVLANWKIRVTADAPERAATRR